MSKLLTTVYFIFSVSKSCNYTLIFLQVFFRDTQQWDKITNNHNRNSRFSLIRDIHHLSLKSCLFMAGKPLFRLRWNFWPLELVWHSFPFEHFIILKYFFFFSTEIKSIMKLKKICSNILHSSSFGASVDWIDFRTAFLHNIKNILDTK